MSQREPIFNLPNSIIIALVVLVIVHVIRISLPNQLDHNLLLHLAFIPARFSSTFPTTTLESIVSVTSWVTYMLIHNDWTHLLMNAAGMLMFGTAVAIRLGTLNFFVFSIVCGVMGAFLHLLIYWGDVAPVIGASAAISGHIAGAIRFIYGALRNNQGPLMRTAPKAVHILKISEFLTDIRVLLFIFIWILVNFIFAFIGYGTDEYSSIAWEAHLGGFFAGLLTFGIFDKISPKPPVTEESAETSAADTKSTELNVPPQNNDS